MKRLNDGFDLAGKAPSFPFYPNDFMRETETCTNLAVGAWTRMLCKMHFSPHRGYLEHANGEPYTEADISALIRESERQTRTILEELNRKGIYSIDERGCIYNRRMARDTKISQLRREAAAKSHSRYEVCSDFATAKVPAKRLQKQLPSSSSSSSKEIHEETGQAAPQAPLESEPNPLEAELQKTAQALRERHPKNRTCGQKEVEKQLRAILKPIPSREKLPMLQTIDYNHKSMCSSFDWQKDNGQFAKGLSNWLAPTQQRYLYASEDSALAKNNTLFGGVQSPDPPTGYQQPDYILQIIAEGGEAFEILRKQRLSQGRDPYTGNRIAPGDQILT